MNGWSFPIMLRIATRPCSTALSQCSTRMRVEHWDNAVEQGRVAMRNLMGKLQPFIHVPYFFSDAFDLSYEFWGDADDHDQVVYRGNMNQKQLSVWWLKKRTLCAALIMNRSEEERAVAPRWILRHPRLDPKALQNARSLKSLDTTSVAKTSSQYAFK